MPGPASRPALWRKRARRRQGMVPGCEDAAQPLRPPASLPFPSLFPSPSHSHALLALPTALPGVVPESPAGAPGGSVCAWGRGGPHVQLSLGRVLLPTCCLSKTEPLPLAAEAWGPVCSPPPKDRKDKSTTFPARVLPMARTGNTCILPVCARPRSGCLQILTHLFLTTTLGAPYHCYL